MRMRLMREDEAMTEGEVLTLSGSSMENRTITGCTYLDTAADEDTEEVTETIEVVLEGTAATVVADIEAIENWLMEAKRYQDEQTGVRVWLEMDLLETGDWWRSEILSGTVSRSTDMRTLLDGQIQIGVHIKRRNYWETKFDNFVPISNANGTNITTGLPVFNGADERGVAPAVVQNWVQIAAGVIRGTLPTPASLELLHVTDTVESLGTIWVGHNWSSDPLNLAHLLEAETGTGGTTVDDSDSSGGKYKSITITAGAEQDLLTWTLSAAFLHAAKGRYFQVYMFRRPAIHNEVLYRLKLMDGTTTVWSSGQTLVKNPGGAIDSLGVIQLPPWLPGFFELRDLTMILTGELTAEGSSTIYPDFFMFMPVDSFRKYSNAAPGLAPGRRLIDDPTNGVYSDNGGGFLLAGGIAAEGPGIWLEPKRIQRLYFLMHGEKALGDLNWTVSVILRYRPRRLRL